MEELIRCRSESSVRDVICPECFQRYSPAKISDNERQVCRACGRQFLLKQDVVITYMTQQLGVCPGCGDACKTSADGTVCIKHLGDDFKPCKGYGMQALRQPGRVTRGKKE